MATDKIERIPGADAFAIALVVLHICIVCTVIPTRFQPYKPVQIVHSPPPVVKVQARFNNTGALIGSIQLRPAAR